MSIKVSFSMTLQLCTLLCACTILSHSVVSQVCEKSTTFSRHPGYKLSGHVISSITTPNLLSCVAKCTATLGCLSINVNVSGGMVQCEMNDNNRHGRQEVLQYIDGDAEYIEMESYNHGSDACLQKGSWYRNKRFAYKFVDETLPMQHARQRCKELSSAADLLSIKDEEEQKLIEDYLNELGVKSNSWLGLNDIATEGTFIWSDGTESNYRKWNSGEPNNSGGSEDCVEIWQSKGMAWNDKMCSAENTFVCKFLCM